jgi:putative hydrolase of the HAD superfamily
MSKAGPFVPAAPAPVVARPERTFAGTVIWIFDLDNTLYPAECRLFVQIDRRMGEFISRLLGVSFEQAQHLRKTYYKQFGTTLNGLMRIHRIEPEPFLDYVHDIDLGVVEANVRLRASIEQLQGRRLIFTNGSRRHAERVAGKIGVLDLFEDICSIETCDFTPKPEAAAFERMIQRHGVAAARAAMFEDMPANLAVPHALGMTTVLVHDDTGHHPWRLEHTAAGEPPDHVHHLTSDLAGFIETVAAPHAARTPPPTRSPAWDASSSSGSAVSRSTSTSSSS